MYNKKIEFVKLEEVDKNPKYRELMVQAVKEPVTRRISVDDAILMVLSAIEYQKSIISRTLLQREVFLFYESICKEYGLSEGSSEAGYFPYKYGPYSIDVNLALSTLIVSGNVRVENYYKHKINHKRFVAKFVTETDFIDIADKYGYLLLSKGMSVDKFQEIIMNKKHGWDQSGTAGINELLLSMGYRNWFKIDTSLEEVLPGITFGKITEDYIPRGKRFARN